MTRLATILTEGFADWETSLVNAAARGFHDAKVVYATPGEQPVTSMGGLRVTPDVGLEDIDLAAIDVLIVCGGTAWSAPDAPDVGELLRAARAAGKVVAAICDGTLALAGAGLLDTVAHTSNGAGHLDATGYHGAGRYRDVPHAVAEDGIITAPGTAPVSFMAEVMRAVGNGGEQLDWYVGMHARQFVPQSPQASL